MSSGTDPVQRLLAIVAAARREGNGTTRGVLARVLGSDPEDDASFLRSYLNLRALFSEAVASVQGMQEIQEELHLVWVRPIGDAISFPNLLQQWSNAAGNLGGTVIQSLQFAAHERARYPQEPRLDKQPLEDLLRKVETLSQEVREAELEPVVTELLLIHLENIRQAILAYHVRGAAVLQKALEEVVGGCVLRRDVVLAAPEKERRKFFGVVENLNKLVTLATNLKALALPLIKLLGAGESGA